MVGVRIGRGWSGEMRKRLPSGDTWTHLKDMLVPLGSAAFQSMHAKRLHQLNDVDANRRSVKIDSCYAYGASRELVLQRRPAFHRPHPSNQQEEPNG
jgi:hypothetical protein